VKGYAGDAEKLEERGKLRSRGVRGNKETKGMYRTKGGILLNPKLTNCGT